MSTARAGGSAPGGAGDTCRRGRPVELIDHERYDRIVAAGAANKGDGFSADDVAWLFERARGEIVILRTGSRA